MDLTKIIRTVPDFPKPGILFYDIASLLMHPAGFAYAIDQLYQSIAPCKADILCAVEARGFLLAAPLALKMGIGFAMIRKKGKLPGPTISHEYDCEYAKDVVQIQQDAIKPGQNIVILDDLLATGGTLAAAINLVEKMGGKVSMCATIIELDGLQGREKISVPISSLVRCPI